MGTIFVAYGDGDRRSDVLSFAVDQATACGHDLLVYHVRDTSDPVPGVRSEIESVVQDRDPYLVYDIVIDTLDDRTGEAGRSKEALLHSAIFESDRDFAYVVMGEVERGPLAEVTHPSLTQAVLSEHAIPVMLVPL